MAKWKFHVILPNGDEYLTETLAEARALEAKHGRTGNHLLFHKRVEDEVPNPRKPAVAPAPAPAAPATLRKTPQKFVATEEVNRDPRLPPVGTVLAKQGLVVVFDVLEDTDVFHVVAPTRADMRGTYTSLSGLVRKFLRVANYNGFQFFGLLERLHSGSKYQVAQLGPKGLAIARSDQDMPVEDYAVTAEIEVEEPEGREGRKPLYGHDSEQTAYVVDGYPYGGYRTQIRYWLEHSPSKGWRFVSQTLNPKTLRWNAPKPSTYALVAGQMFLDDQQHVVWERLTEYSEADEVRQFLKDFPRTDKSMLEKWIPAKVAHYQKQVSMIGKGVSGWMIGGKPVPVESGDLEVAQRQLAAWQSAAEQLKVKPRSQAPERRTEARQAAQPRSPRPPKHDNRLPPVGVVLANRTVPTGEPLIKYGGPMFLVVDQDDGGDVFHVVAPTRPDVRGTYTSLSEPVEKYLRGQPVDGYQFFGLLDGFREGKEAGRVGPLGIEVAREDKNEDVQDYAYRFSWMGGNVRVGKEEYESRLPFFAKYYRKSPS